MVNVRSSRSQKNRYIRHLRLERAGESASALRQIRELAWQNVDDDPSPRVNFAMPTTIVAPIAVARARVPERSSEPALLAKAFAELGMQNSDEWGWENYERVLRHLVERNGARQLLEIGGGRNSNSTILPGWASNSR
jgi:hypothetical protein